MRPDEELLELAAKLDALASRVTEPDIEKPLKALDDVAREVRKSFSGSWAGYHSKVYYEGFNPPPTGARFSQEWGLQNRMGSSGTRGEWREYSFEEVESFIELQAGNPDLTKALEASKRAAEFFVQAQSDIQSILSHQLSARDDEFIKNLKQELDRLEPLSKNEIANRWHTPGRFMTRDTIVIGQGTQMPPHISVMAKVASIRCSFDICKLAASIARKAGSHLARQDTSSSRQSRIGTNVFIGHGRSSAWRELKDFVRDRLKLPFDEFNRVPVAGVTNIARLSEMLDAAAIAFVIMTAEDEQKDGKVQARMNVIHEVGLFQGRLGFTKGIIILEEGCEEFSNIQGLGQIRFPHGKISAAFEDVRQVLEREGLLSTD